MGKQSKKQKKSQRKVVKQKRHVIKLRLYEPIIEVDHYGFKHKVPVVVLAGDWKEAYMKAQNSKWWKKTGIRPVEEFR